MFILRSIYSTLVLTSLIAQVLGYAGYRTFIPNGETVPHPCNPNWIWEGVGHDVRGGGGDRNPFGQDFDDEGKQWTQALCLMDSDGDGKTNGEELGDPNCLWLPGSEPERTVGLSHPGICDPLGSATCDGRFKPNCDEEKFKCDAINDVGVFKHDVRIPPTPVPARETTYTCMYVELPTDGDYHLIADTPIIDNVNVMHHMLLYACQDPSKVNEEFNTPKDCFMSRAGCEQIIAGWTVGSNGECFDEAAGFRVGNAEGAYTVAMLELHWNNPGFEDGWTDSSGLALYLTPNLRPYDAGVLMIGQLYLEIPPQEASYVAESTCSASCTREYMQGSIYIMSAANHMHYLGRKGFSEVILPNGERRSLAFDPVFNYDRPITYAFDEPLRLEPGHELTLKCHFTSTSRSKTTFYGEGTNDEMCFAFLNYYPKQNFTSSSCVSYGEADSCELEGPIIQGCNTTMLSDSSHPENVKRYTDLEASCSIGFCRKECIAVVKEINAHACYQGVMRKNQLSRASYLTEETGLHFHNKFWGMLQSCDADILRETLESVIDQTGGTSSSVIPTGSVLVVLMAFLLNALT